MSDAAGPSHAERARTLVAMQQTGALSTLAQNPAGYPFGSVVSYAIDDAGRPLLCLSRLAEHTTNFTADPRASLLVTEQRSEMGGKVDPLALGRVTLLGNVRRVDEPAPVRERYLAAHPAAARYVDFADFAFYSLEIEAVRYVGGFGRMSWVEAVDYARAEPDPLAPSRGDILAHMNQDHGAAMLAYAHALVGHPTATAATMTSIDRYGFDMNVTLPDGVVTARLGFDPPLSTPMEARAALVAMAKKARSS